MSLVYRVDIKSGSGNGCKYISIADISYKNRSSKQVLMKEMEIANVLRLQKMKQKLLWNAHCHQDNCNQDKSLLFSDDISN